MPPTTAQRLAARIPPPGRRPVLRQEWRRLLFLHWEIDPASLQARLPPGLKVDAWQGRAYLGVIPFLMRRVHPVGLFPVPLLSDFLELNVRTYVHDEHGVPGVWFFSLDADQPLAVELARHWFHLNYRHAAMAAAPAPDGLHYHCRRRGERAAAAYHYESPRSTTTAVPGTLEFFLLERYFLYAWRPRARRLFRGQVAHPPYRFQVTPPPPAWSDLPARWEGFAPAGAPVHAAVAEDVTVDAYAISPVS